MQHRQLQKPGCTPALPRGEERKRDECLNGKRRSGPSEVRFCVWERGGGSSAGWAGTYPIKRRPHLQLPKGPRPRRAPPSSAQWRGCWAHHPPLRRKKREEEPVFYEAGAGRGLSAGHTLQVCAAQQAVTSIEVEGAELPPREGGEGWVSGKGSSNREWDRSLDRLPWAKKMHSTSTRHRGSRTRRRRCRSCGCSRSSW